MPLPADLEHWMAWHPRLEEELDECLGVVLLLVNLKLSPLRVAFMHAWHANVASTGVTGTLLYKAMAAAAAVVLASKVLVTHGARDCTRYSIWQRECNAQTSHHHGGLAFLRRWGVLRGGTIEDPLRVEPLSGRLERALARVLDPEVAQVVRGVRAVDTLREWVQQIEEVVPAMQRLGLPGLTTRSGCNHKYHMRGCEYVCALSGSCIFLRFARYVPYIAVLSGYGVAWTLRCLVLRQTHRRDVAAGTLERGICMNALRFNPADSTTLLSRGFPDQSGEAAWFARKNRAKTVGILMAALQYRDPVQCLCMDLCLAKVAYRFFLWR